MIRGGSVEEDKLVLRRHNRGGAALEEERGDLKEKSKKCAKYTKYYKFGNVLKYEIKEIF